MKRFIRNVVFYTIAIYVVSLIIPGFKLVTDIRGLVLSGLTLSLLFAFVRPILSLLLLPINILTLGLFSFLSQVLTFYLFLFLFPSYVHIQPWQFLGWTFAPIGLNIAPFEVGQFVTVVISTFLTSLIVATLSFFL